MSQTTGMGVDSGSLGDKQSARGASPLSIILKGKVSMNVILVRPKPRHRTENDTMLEVHTTDTDRLKELGHGHCENSARGKLWVFGEEDCPRPSSGHFIRRESYSGFDLHSFTVEPEAPRSIKEGRNYSAELLPGREKMTRT